MLKNFKICFIAPLVLISVLGLAACQTQESATAVSVPDESLPTATIAATDTPTYTPPPTAEVVLVDECIACHTDKQRLIDTAAPVLVVESENEGVG